MSRTYGLLRERIIRSDYDYVSFAKALGMSRATLSAKLNSKSDWTVGEIEKICDVLHIDLEEITRYFFYE